MMLYTAGGWPFRKPLSRDMADLLTSLLVPNFWDPAELQAQVGVEIGMEQVALALAAYKAEKGSYPEQLSDLAPGYIKEIPLDIFTGKPLIYKPQGKGYLLYSVGPNMIDNGGRAKKEDPEQKADDIAVRVGLPPATADK